MGVGCLAHLVSRISFRSFPASVEVRKRGKVAESISPRYQKTWGSWVSVKDNVLFLRDWVRDPLQVAAIAPSSLSLAHIMTSEISFCDAPILELGPGTGVFTRRLLQKGIPQENLVLVESSQAFADLLGWRFPKAKIICCDASKLIVNEHLLPGTPGGRHQRVAAGYYAGTKGNDHYEIRFSKPEERFVLLPIHLRPKMPRRCGDPRPMRPELDAHRTHIPQPTARLGISDFPKIRGAGEKRIIACRGGPSAKKAATGNYRLSRNSRTSTGTGSFGVPRSGTRGFKRLSRTYFSSAMSIRYRQ